MADTNVKLTVSVETQQAEQNVDNLNKKLDQTKQKTDNVNAATSKGASSISSWGTAFEKMLNEASKGTSSLGGSLGSVTSALKTAIPIIKNISSTATAGLKAIKGGIAGTGIGLLLIALTEIISHWKEIASWIGISTDRQNDYKKAVEDSNKAVQDLSGELDYQRKLQEAAGADAVSIAQQKVEDERKLGEELNKQYLQRVKEGNYSTRQIKKMQEELNKEMEIRNEALKKAQQELTIAQTRADTAARTKAEAEGQAAAAKSKAQAEKQALEYLNAQKSVYGVLDQLVKEGSDSEFWKSLLDPSAPNLPAANLLKRIQEQGKNITSELVQDAINGNKVLLEEEEKFAAERIKQINLGADFEIQTEQEKAEAVYRIEEEIWQKRIALAEDSLKAAETFDSGNLLLINQLAGALKLLKEQYVTFELEYEKTLETVEEDLQKFLDDQQDLLNQGLSQSLHTWNEYLGALSEVGANVGSIFDSMVEAQKNQIEMDQKLGKISEEEAKKRFQQLKGYEIAANWINTLAGVANVVASPEGRAGVLGWAIQATQIAAIIAAGIARDRQIRNSYIDNPDMGSSGNGGMAGATPLQVMSDITPSPTMNIPVSSEDTRVYILESDIQKSNNRVKVREDNTTW